MRRHECSIRPARCEHCVQELSAQGVGVLIKKSQAMISGRHVRKCTQAKTKQDTAFDPGICSPRSIIASFGSAHFAATQGFFQFCEKLLCAWREDLVIYAASSSISSRSDMCGFFHESEFL